MLALFSGAFLGWGLGANDSSNIFGTAVSSRMISYRKAVILISIFASVGAITMGKAGVYTLESITTMHQNVVVTSTLAAAICVAIMTKLAIPISTSQALGGAIFTLAALDGDLNFSVFLKMISAWVATPIGGAFIAFLLYHFFAYCFRLIKPNIYARDTFLRYSLIICGCYGAYSLGANNVANCALVFRTHDAISLDMAIVLGSIFISLGAITYSKKVMMTVGKGVVKLDAFSAFITVLSHSVTLHLFAGLGIPVSSSQAIVGSIIGISFVKGCQVLNFPALGKIFLAWLATPFIGGIVALFIRIIL